MRSSTDYVNEKDDLFSGFYSSTCAGNNVYDIFDDECMIVTEDSIVWFNTNKIVWEESFIKTPYSEFPQDSNYFKLIYIHTNK